MNRGIVTGLTLSLLLLAAGGAIATPPVKESGVLIVTLNPAARLKDPVVRLEDVATLLGPTALRDKAAKLDLAERTGGGESLLTRDEIYYRLLLSGMEPRSFRITGPAHVALRWDEATLKDTDLVAAARAALDKALPAAARDVSIRLVRPPSLPVLPGTASHLRFVAETPAATSGRVRVDVALHVRDKRHAVVPVFFDVTYAGGEPEVVIKARDRVRLVALVGGFRVTALGEAMQEGRLGQTIRVRNIDSSKIISGRIVERNMVEVEY